MHMQEPNEKKEKEKNEKSENARQTLDFMYVAYQYP